MCVHAGVSSVPRCIFVVTSELVIFYVGDLNLVESVSQHESTVELLLLQ
jgi:hypothetical protein